MHNYFYDLHIHSCLSPCADDDMTPANIAGMGALCGLNVMALTDHNATRNLPAFFKACKTHGIVPVGGMELTTAEEVHIICLFEDLDSAMSFGEQVYKHLPDISNRSEIFGNQLIVDDEDNILGREDKLLLAASDLALEDAVKLVRNFGGVAYPAHIDRDSNGIIAVLGDIPPEPDFRAYELNERLNLSRYSKQYPLITGMKMLACSDAHRLWEINEAESSLEIDDEPYSSQKVRSELIKLLKGGL